MRLFKVLVAVSMSSDQLPRRELGGLSNPRPLVPYSNPTSYKDQIPPKTATMKGKTLQASR